jgi:hypothetical protein
MWPRSGMKAWSTGGPGPRNKKAMGGEPASRALSGGAGSMRWDGLATVLNLAQDWWLVVVVVVVVQW